ncbi:MAG: hypothetical protein HYW78_01875 [Parcubacteria group bacterium]|nr:hypothetical protein [Parcubacteria group bacterium]
MAIYKVGVVGGGAMGQGIAMLIAQQGIQVVVKEMNTELASKAQEKMFKRIGSAVERGKIMSDKGEMAKALIATTADYNDLKDVDLIIEAVFERMDIKKKVFAELDALVPLSVIFATNTSSLSITEMATVVQEQRKDKIIGVHFFNPPVTMPLIELISGKTTSIETVDALEDFTKNSLGKIPIRIKECPGFLANRLLLPYLNEATLLLSETTLTIKEIDSIAQHFGWPMGPFILLDYLGIDIGLEVAKILYEGYGERVKPAQLMQILVEKKRYGQKAGAGFYVYDETKGFEDSAEIVSQNFQNRVALDLQEAFKRMLYGFVNEAFLCLEEGIASAEDIETGCKYGIGFPMVLGGPLHWAESEGLVAIFVELKQYEQKYGIRFKPSKLLEEYATNNKKIFDAEW